MVIKRKIDFFISWKVFVQILINCTRSMDKLQKNKTDLYEKIFLLLDTYRR